MDSRGPSKSARYGPFGNLGPGQDSSKTGHQILHDVIQVMMRLLGNSPHDVARVSGGQESTGSINCDSNRSPRCISGGGQEMLQAGVLQEEKRIVRSHGSRKRHGNPATHRCSLCFRSRPQRVCTPVNLTKRQCISPCSRSPAGKRVVSRMPGLCCTPSAVHCLANENPVTAVCGAASALIR